MARVFDSSGRLWFVTLNAEKLRHVRKQTGIDLRHGNTLAALDAAAVADVLHACCFDQAAARQMNAVDFRRCFPAECAKEAARILSFEIERLAADAR